MIVDSYSPAQVGLVEEIRRSSVLLILYYDRQPLDGWTVRVPHKTPCS